jgi:hypothetical protein
MVNKVRLWIADKKSYRIEKPVDYRFREATEQDIIDWCKSRGKVSDIVLKEWIETFYVEKQKIQELVDLYNVDINNGEISPEGILYNLLGNLENLISGKREEKVKV